MNKIYGELDYRHEEITNVFVLIPLLIWNCEEVAIRKNYLRVPLKMEVICGC
jgi:hypothetical protein